MKSVLMAVLFVCLSCFSLAAADKVVIPAGSKVFVAPMNGYETFLIAALHNKKVPVIVVNNREKADFEITGTSETQKAGWAKVIFAGGRSDEEASISVADIKSGEVVFAYNVNKRSSVHGQQSSAESCAKHIKDVVGKSQ